mmetsp:Transcript_30159/g.77452  ORF Transcript_30159/g.77452 Transcript_30159/m.77452 type:complete len:204 (-) Transcript_30159:287-898(-)
MRRRAGRGAQASEGLPHPGHRGRHHLGRQRRHRPGGRPGRGVPQRQRRHCRLLQPRLGRGLHCDHDQRPRGGHRRVPRPPWPPRHPALRPAHHPHRLRRAQQGPGPRGVHLPHAAGRPQGDGRQRREPSPGGRRSGGRRRHPSLAELCRPRAGRLWAPPAANAHCRPARSRRWLHRPARRQAGSALRHRGRGGPRRGLALGPL